MTYLLIERRDREVKLYALDEAHHDATAIWIRVPDSNRVTFGRGAPRPPTEAHVQLPDEVTLSRMHFAIARRPDGGVSLSDLGSSGGTFVNRLERVLKAQPYELRDGDVVYLGAPSNALRMWIRNDRRVGSSIANDRLPR